MYDDINNNEQENMNHYDTGSTYTHYDSSEAMNQGAGSEETEKRRIWQNCCKMSGSGIGIRKCFQCSLHGSELCGKPVSGKFCEKSGVPE